MPVRPLLLGLLAAAALSASACAQTRFETSGDPAFDAWREGFAERAEAQGFSRSLVHETLGGLRPLPGVQRANDNQPEFVRPVWDYLRSAVSQSRIQEGRALFQARREALERAAGPLGVPAEVGVAIWGMESSYGKVTGDFDVPAALATLAFEGRRAAFGEAELLASMQILQRGEATRARLRGSWAGAMGHTQFIPSTFLAMAVDGDGDGKRDIWGNPLDALASTENYLRASGWRRGEPWGVEVTPPAGFDFAIADGAFRPGATWLAAGLTSADGKPIPPEWEARLLLPAGAQGAAFLVGRNFDAIRTYNNSDSYALAVGLLSDQIAGLGALPTRWPVTDPPLSRPLVREAQTLLTGLGYDTGGVDGQAGPRTRRAIQLFQQGRGLVADGYPSAGALAVIREASAAAPARAPSPPAAGETAPQG
jgi:membrane-bound lytic murein transglycosylase B